MSETATATATNVVTIYRDLVDPDDYRLCYIGQWASRTGNMTRLKYEDVPVPVWADTEARARGWSKDAPTFSTAVSDACFHLDEVLTSELFERIGIKLEFVNSYPPKLVDYIRAQYEDKEEPCVRLVN